MNFAFRKISCPVIAALQAQGTAQLVVDSFALRMHSSLDLSYRHVPRSLIVAQRQILLLSHMGSL